MFGNINLKNGLEIKVIKIKKDFEIMNQFYINDPDEFKNLQFIVPSDVQSTAANLKGELSSNYEYYKILDNKDVIGYLQTHFSSESSSLIMMLGANYAGGKSLASIIVHFKNKLIKFGNVSIVFSENDYLTTHLLESVGVSSNILYLAGENIFQFIGSDFENAQPEDWEEINSKLSFVDFFTLNNIKESEKYQDTNNYLEEQPQDEGEYYDDSEDQDNNNVIDFDDEEEIITPGVSSQTHAVAGYDKYQNPINYVPETNAIYVGKKGKDGNLNVNHALSKFHPTSSNVSEYVKEIKKIPSNVAYSKINPDLFTTIKGTPTFKSFEDSSIDNNHLNKEKKFSSAWESKVNVERKVGFGSPAGKVDVLNTRNTSFQDMIKARNAELDDSKNKQTKNRQKDKKSSSFGFASGVITI